MERHKVVVDLKNGEDQMGQERKHYTREFKIEAFQLVETSGKPVSVIERELGLSSICISNWRKKFSQKGKNAFPSKGWRSEEDA